MGYYIFSHSYLYIFPDKPWEATTYITVLDVRQKTEYNVDKNLEQNFQPPLQYPTVKNIKLKTENYVEETFFLESSVVFRLRKNINGIWINDLVNHVYWFNGIVSFLIEMIKIEVPS